MNIRDIINVNSIALNLEVKDKTELINKMAELAFESGKIIDLNEVKNRLFVREKLMSTGIGNSIALPHAKSNKIKKTIGSFAVLSNPIDYESLDNKPVNIVLMIIGRESNISENLKLLSSISKIINNDSFITVALAARSAEDILEIFERQNE